MSSMEKLSPVITVLRAARLALVEHLDDELALESAQLPVLRPVGAFEQRRREALDRRLAGGYVRDDEGFHGAVEPDLREHGRRYHPGT